MALKIQFYGKSKKGPKKKINEDVQLIHKDQFAIICDGVGGKCENTSASKVAAETDIECD